MEFWRQNTSLKSEAWPFFSNTEVSPSICGANCRIEVVNEEGLTAACRSAL